MPPSPKETVASSVSPSAQAAMGSMSVQASSAAAQVLRSFVAMFIGLTFSLYAFLVASPPALTSDLISMLLSSVGTAAVMVSATRRSFSKVIASSTR